MVFNSKYDFATVLLGFVFGYLTLSLVVNLLPNIISIFTGDVVTIFNGTFISAIFDEGILIYGLAGIVMVYLAMDMFGIKRKK